MARDGSGGWQRLYDWTTDRDAGGATKKISADRMDAEMDDMASGLAQSISRDGQTTTTASIPFAQGLSCAGNATFDANVTLGNAAGDTITINGTPTFATAVTFSGALTASSTLTVTGAATMNGNVTLGDAAADTVTVNGTPTFAENVTLTKDLTVNGNTTLGNANTDTLTVTARLASGLTWGTDATHDIGASGANRPRDVFASRNAVFGGTLAVTGAVTFSSTMAADSLQNTKATINESSATSLTLDATYAGEVIWTTSSSSITHTLSASAPVGTNITVTQGGTGQITFAAGSGGSLRNRSSHTKTAGRYGTVSVFVVTNSGGSAAEWVLTGDTAT